MKWNEFLLPNVISPIRSMTTCIGKRFCGSDGDISDTLFDNGVSVSRRICSKNSSNESRSRWRTTSSYNLYEEFYLENELRKNKLLVWSTR